MLDSLSQFTLEYKVSEFPQDNSIFIDYCVETTLPIMHLILISCNLPLHHGYLAQYISSFHTPDANIQTKKLVTTCSAGQHGVRFLLSSLICFLLFVLSPWLRTVLISLCSQTPCWTWSYGSDSWQIHRSRLTVYPQTILLAACQPPNQQSRSF